MAPRNTVEKTSYPFPVRVANAAIGVAECLRIPMPEISVEAFMRDSSKVTGLSDFGDERFLEGMRHLMDNVDTLGFTPLSRQVLRGTFMQGLKNRLQYQDIVARNPEILDIAVDRPVFVLGFPRTGTTVLQNLLALDDNRRGLQFWELFTPVTQHDDPVVDRQIRDRNAAFTLKVAHFLAPEQREVHDIREDTLEECWYLFWNSMRVLNWDIQTGLHSYGQWLLNECDMAAAYAEYKGWLQVLLHQRPANGLVLKCPEHLWFIDSLLETFPDACIVWTHRDPVASVASYCSMMSLTRRVIHGRFVPEEMGPYITDRFWEGVSRAMAARDAFGDDSRFIDVDFKDVVDDPVGTVQNICQHFDLEQSDDLPARINGWLNSGREDGRGKHVYSAERFNVDPKRVYDKFAPYIDRFDIDLHHT